jgi:hypothetical protein
MPAGAVRDFDARRGRNALRNISRSEMTTVVITLRVKRNVLSGP